MNKKKLLLLALVALLSGAISISLLTRGQSWLDDFAQYILQARSIVRHTTGDFISESAFTVSNSSYPPGPVAYPWGFPLMLAPIYAFMGLNTLAMQLLNTLSYMLFLVVFYALARTRLKDLQALLLTAVLAFNPVLLTAHTQIISDIPFLLFSTLGVFLIDRFGGQKKPLWAGIAIGTVIFIASFIRTNGPLLLVPLAVAQLYALRQQFREGASSPGGLLQKLAPALLTFGCLYGLQGLIFPNGQGSYVTHFSMFSPAGLWENFVYYLGLPAAVFNGLPGGVALYSILLVFVLLSVLKRDRRDVAIHAYSLATIGVFIFWPERQGLRFIYPVLPFLFIFAFQGLELAMGWLKASWQKRAEIGVAGLWIALAVASLWVSIDLGRTNLADGRTITGPFDPVSAEMFNYLREKTPADSVVVFFKPRSMHLMSDRNSFITDNCAQLSKADYLALSKKVEANGLIPLQELSLCKNVSLRHVFQNRRFVVYQISP